MNMCKLLKSLRLPVAIAACLLWYGAAGAETWHVNGVTGDDGNDGRSVEKPFKSILKSAALVQPGDTVVVHPGVYFGSIELKRAGTAEKPIVFRTDAVKKGSVVLSNANVDARTGKATWTLEDESVQLYSTPFLYQPARVLYDDNDLAPYISLDGLKQFLLAPDTPGVLKGYYFDKDAKKLYVRLHPPSKDYDYGSQDPRQHVMALGAPIGKGEKGVVMGTPDWCNINVNTDGPAYIVIDGFTFETPGSAGVLVQSSHVTVRNSWFNGCRAAVAGAATERSNPKNGNNVTVEYCDYTQNGVYADAEEMINLYIDDPKFKDTRWFWWHRKGMKKKDAVIYNADYETSGIGHRIGKGWIFRNNYIHDVFDGQGAQGMEWAEDVEYSHNRFERCVDNALEVENHGKNVSFHDNEVIDTFMPLSYQVMGGLPWPGPVYVYRNLIYMTPRGSATWDKATPNWVYAFFKAGTSVDNWTWWYEKNSRGERMPLGEKGKPADTVHISGEGFLTYNNTIYMPGANFLEVANGSAVPRKTLGFKFFNNIIVTKPTANRGKPISPDVEYEFWNNVYGSSSELTPELGKIMAGKDGVVLPDPTRIGFADPSKGRFELTAGSPAIAAGADPKGRTGANRDAGAIPFGSTWTSPVVGPQPRTN